MTHTRTAIRYYCHMLKVIGYENTPTQGIVHHTDGSSRLWVGRDICWIDREPTEVFIDDGLNESDARKELVEMCKEAIARVEKLN